MRNLCGLAILIGLVLLTGCARFPSTPGGGLAPTRTLYTRITVNGVINPEYYYYLAIGTDQTGATGPLPVVTGPELANGWGIIGPIGPDSPLRQPPFFVQYHNGQFVQFRTDPTTGQAVPLGQPYRFGVDQDRKSLWVEIDQSLLGSPIPNLVELNWITDEVIDTQPQNLGAPKQYDGFGRTGNDYLLLPINVSQTLESGVNGAPDEYPYLSVYPDGLRETTTSLPDIDLIRWQVEVRISQ